MTIERYREKTNHAVLENPKGLDREPKRGHSSAPKWADGYKPRASSLRAPPWDFSSQKICPVRANGTHPCTIELLLPPISGRRAIGTLTQGGDRNDRNPGLVPVRPLRGERRMPGHMTEDDIFTLVRYLRMMLLKTGLPGFRPKVAKQPWLPGSGPFRGNEFMAPARTPEAVNGDHKVWMNVEPASEGTILSRRFSRVRVE